MGCYQDTRYTSEFNTRHCIGGWMAVNLERVHMTPCMQWYTEAILDFINQAAMVSLHAEGR